MTNKELAGLIAELSGKSPLDVTRPRRTGEAPQAKPKGFYVLFSSPGRCSAAISAIRDLGWLNTTKLHCGLAQPARSPRWQRLQLDGARASAAGDISYSISRLHNECKEADLIGDFCTRTMDLDQLWSLIDSPDWWDERQVSEAIAEFTRAEHLTITEHTDEAPQAPPSSPTPRQQPGTMQATSMSPTNNNLSQDMLYQNIMDLHEPGTPTGQPANIEGVGPARAQRAGADADTVVLVADSQSPVNNSQPAAGNGAHQGTVSEPSSSAEYASSAPSTDLAQQRHNILGTPSDLSEAPTTTGDSSGMGTHSGPTPPSVTPPRRGHTSSTPASLAANLVAVLATTTIPRSPTSRRKQQDSPPGQAGAKKPRLAIPASQESPSSPPGSDPTPGPAKSQ